MSPEQFKAWRKHMGFSQQEAAEALGASRRALQNYEKSEEAMPRTIELACAALALGIRSYEGPQK